MNNPLQKLILRLCAIRFFDEFILIYPLYVVMFGEYGVSELQISTLLLVWHIVAFSLEVPSGVWADKFSRKYVLALGQFFRIIGYSFWILFPNFVGFLIGFLFWGIKSAMLSGTFEALVYDELKNNDIEGEYLKIIGKTKSVSQISTILALFSGSYFYFLGGYQFVIFLSILSMAFYMAMVLKLPEVKSRKNIHEDNYLQYLKEGVLVSVQNYNILRIIVFTGLFVGIGAIDEYWGIFAQEIGYSTYNVGILFGSVALSCALGSLFAYRFSSWTFQQLLFYGIISGFLLCFSAILYHKTFSTILLILFGFIFQIVSTVMDGKLQSQIPSKVRATIGSVQSFAQNISASIMFVIFGWIATEFDYQTSFLAFGALIVVISLIFLRKTKIN